MNHYPVLVYGTLRPTGSNYGRFLAGRTTRERTVALNGFRMFGGSGYPYVIIGNADDMIVGTLCDIDTAEYDDTVRDLDFLEGYIGLNDDNNHYDRILVEFTANGETIKAWTYVASEQIVDYIVKDLPVVEHGDWLEFHKDQISAREIEREWFTQYYEAEDAAILAKGHSKARISRAQKKIAKRLASVPA